MDMLKKVLFSEKGMKIVNLLFFLSLIFRNRGVIFVAYAVWIVYLSYCVKTAPTKASKGIYSVLIAFASIVLALDLYFLFRAF